MPELLTALARPYPVVLAPTGMIPTKAMSPHVPLTPAEVADDVAEAARLGLTSVHLHARDEDGSPDWRRDTYARFVDAVKSRVPDMVINVSTSGRNWSDLERRADCLALEGDLKPDLASLTLSSMNFASGPSVNSPDTIRQLARMMLDRGIVPELEVFDLGMLNMIGVLERAGLLPGPVVVNLFFGNIAGAQATLSEMGLMVDRLPDGAIWSGGGLGDYQGVAQTLALAAGGGVRVGLEDGIHVDRTRTRLARNADLVERVHQAASILGRRCMTPSEFRDRILGGRASTA